MQTMEIKGKIPKESIFIYNTIIWEISEAAMKYIEATDGKNIKRFFREKIGPDLKKFIEFVKKETHTPFSREFFIQLALTTAYPMNINGQLYGHKEKRNYGSKQLLLLLLEYILPKGESITVTFKERQKAENYTLKGGKNECCNPKESDKKKYNTGQNYAVS